MATVYSKNHAKHINALCQQYSYFLMLKQMTRLVNILP
jgi:hypothetical protein